VIFQPNETADARQANQETNPELKELRRREGRLLNPVRSGVQERARVPPVSMGQEMSQEMDEMVGQLKSLRLSKTELAVAARSMPFLDRTRMDPRKLTTLLNQATVQSPAQGYSPAPGYEDWQNSTRPPQDSRYPQDSTTFGRPQQDARGQRSTRGQGRQTCF
jgi:hypothetical protein